ncbi:MAG TPA: DUF2269 family protein [Candidatus Limnocylindrales bacterium]|nr:DUF2269 family protein [Candidatus Limnocylindrales bacterium]
MSPIVAILLFLHVAGAIIAFGPSFAMPIIGAMGGKEPMHANFATRVTLQIEERIIVPLALFQAVTGIGLIWFAGFNLIESHWLLLGIILYVIALAFAMAVQTNSVKRVIELTTMPAGGPPPGAPAGPPPGVPEAVQRVQRGGMFLGIMILVIVFLMVVKPAF